LLLFFLFASGGLAQEKPTIEAKLTTIRPKIDGRIEPIWFLGDSAKNFIQQRPDEGKPATESTTVYLLYDPENLYVAFKCYCRNRKEINRQVIPRDNYGGDRVGLLLATFEDQKTGYYFVVNAGGVQADYTVTDDFRNWDFSWDGIIPVPASLTSATVLRLLSHFAPFVINRILPNGESILPAIFQLTMNNPIGLLSRVKRLGSL